MKARPGTLRELDSGRQVLDLTRHMPRIGFTHGWSGNSMAASDAKETTMSQQQKDALKDIFRLSSLFGGDSRDATPANLLLTGRFQAPALASKVAHSCEASVRAHSAGLPWPTGDPLSQTPRSTTSTVTRQATTHREQNPPAHGHNRPRALCREPQDLAACDQASAPIAGSDRPGDGGIQQQASSRQGPDSPQIDRSPDLGGTCQWPSSSPHWRPRISPLAAIFSPRWWPRISPPTD